MSTPGIHKLIKSGQAPFAMIPNSVIRDPEITPNAFRLLAYLMSHENGYELTYDQIERQTSLGRSAINSAIKLLTLKSYLITAQTKLPNGYFGPKTWTLLDPSTVDETATESNRNGLAPYGAINGHKENNLIKKTTVKENKETRTNARNVFEQQFEQFYNLYPRKVSKAKAKLKLEAALKKTSFDVIMGGLQAYIDNNQFSSVQFVAHPNQWLMDERWDDDYSTIGFTPKKTQRELEKEAMDQWMKEQEALENEIN